MLINPIGIRVNTYVYIYIYTYIGFGFIVVGKCVEAKFVPCHTRCPCLVPKFQYSNDKLMPFGPKYTLMPKLGFKF